MGQTAAMAMTAASTYGQYAGQQRQATAALEQGTYEKAIDDTNASMAARQAADALSVGGLKANQELGQTRQVMGAGKAALAAQGVDVGTGSAVDVGKNTMQLGELDALTIENNAARAAWGFDVEAGDYTMKGQQALFAGENKAAGLKAASMGTLITGATEEYGLATEGKPKMPRLTTRTT